ncbi:type I restriction-modification system subunit M [Aliarcobacter butzleri]|uniref:type I restriction-modification system subunit M n=1 Tax=Aliarcobacter butzleri TaxID=28197 RepID=UPI0002295715|nr:type I restriction-modification system subunit M [Aliarcobacter butzleri]BAK70521.1 restriction-modification system subunit M [Aliarcobacter butzleri ED-1]
MAIKKTELYSSLWASADELRGGMDASEYKNYVLTLLFMKYVSDKKDDANSLIDVPKGASFEDMIALDGDKEIGDKINKIIAKLAEENDLKGIIDTADFNDSTKLGSGKQMVDTLSKLIKIFDTLNLGSNRAEGDDLLGDAYEYLMRHFATESGKSKGQFYTPSEVSTILPQIIGIDENTTAKQTIYDPTCGSGSLLLKASALAPNGLSIYGQEKEVSTTALCKMNMILHNNASAVIAPGGQSTLANPFFEDEPDVKLKTFDFVVANPPFSLKAWTNGVENPDKYSRFDGFVTPPEKNGDYAFLLHICKSMKSNAKGAVILPHGVLFRGNAEGVIREKLIRKGWIKGIIGLPANLFYGTGIPACIIVLDKENAQNRSGIFMIDASKGFKKDGNKNRLRSQDVHKIVDTFNKTLEIEKYSKMVTLRDIELNEYNLNIPRYIDSSESEDIQDLFAHLNGGIPNVDIENLGEYWDVFKTLKSELFEPSVKDGYSNAKIESNEIKSFILNHDEFKKFSRDVFDLYKKWDYFERFYNLDIGFKPKELIYEISENLLEKFKDIKLISKYDIYQILMDYWAETMQDDCYLISQDGWGIGSNLRELIPSKDKNDKNVYKEAHHFEFNKIRYVADLIPPKLLINRYFEEEQKAIDELQLKLDSASSELENFIEENSGEDGLLEDAKNDKGNISKKTIDDRLKITKDTEEIKALKECKKLLELESKAKKDLKDAVDKLTLAVFKKYRTLSIEDIKEIVIEDKWLKHISNQIKEEINRVTTNLANRIKTLEERYKEPLKTIENDVNILSKKVEEHLKAMGLSW